jgi:hypothetical protein
MALVIKDRVKESSTTIGTGAYTLAGAEAGFQTFSAIGDGNTTYYAATDGTYWEVGIGTYTASGTTLARTTILSSSNSNNAVNWTAGEKLIFVTQPSSKASFLDASDNAGSLGSITATLTGNVTGNLTGNVTGNVTGSSGSVDAADNAKAKFGNSDDLQIYHDGSNSYINETGTGDLYIKCNDEIRIQGQDDANLIYAQQDGSVGLYYNGSNKFSTTNTGIAVTGNVTVTGTVDGRDILTDGTKLDLVSVTQAVDLDQIETDIAALANGMVYKGDWDASSGSFPSGAQTGWFYYVSVAGTVNSVAFHVGDNIVATTDNASTSVYANNWSKHDNTDAVQSVVGLTGSITKSGLLTAINVEDGADVTDATNVTAAGALMDNEVTNLSQVKAFDTTDYATAAQGTKADAALPKAGGAITGNVTWGDNQKALFGAGSDLQIYHDGSNSYIKENGTGALALQTNGTAIVLEQTDGENMILANINSDVKLYYNGSEKLATTSTGINVTGNVAATGSVSLGDWTITEDANGKLSFAHSGTVKMTVDDTGTIAVANDVLTDETL